MSATSLFGPIPAWELATTARRGRYFVVRVAYVLFLLLLLQSTYANAFGHRPFPEGVTAGNIAQFSRSFFELFGYVQLTAVLVFTPAYVGGAIAGEKQQRTLEHVLVTNLTNREIVFGKMVARLLNVFAVVLAGLPVLFFARWLGGIDYARLVALTLTTASTLIATASVAIAASVHARDVRAALSQAYGILLFLLISPHLCLVFMYVVSDGAAELEPIIETVFDATIRAQPYFAFATTLQTGWRLGGTGLIGPQILWMVGIHGAVALACLGLAVVRLRTRHMCEQKVVAKSGSPQVEGRAAQARYARSVSAR